MPEEKLIEKLIQIRRQHQQAVVSVMIEKITNDVLSAANAKKRDLVVEISLKDDESDLDIEEITDMVVRWCENQELEITNAKCSSEGMSASFTISGW